MSIQLSKLRLIIVRKAYLEFRLRMERRESFNEHLEGPVSSLRKKINYMTRENNETLNKLRILEPQNEKLESDNERLSKDNRRLEKKNRALMEAQRVYELDKKETEVEMRVCTALKNTFSKY